MLIKEMDFTPLLWKTKPDFTRCVHVLNYSQSSRMNKAFLFSSFVLFLPFERLYFWTVECWEKTLMTVCLFFFFFATQTGNQSAEHLEMKTLTHLSPLPTSCNLFFVKLSLFNIFPTVCSDSGTVSFCYGSYFSCAVWSCQPYRNIWAYEGAHFRFTSWCRLETSEGSFQQSSHPVDAFWVVF